MYNLRNRSFLKEIDFTPQEFRFLLQLCRGAQDRQVRRDRDARASTGKEIALIFEKTSTRTRSAFEVAAFDQGAHVTYLDPSGSQMGHKESVADTARVLGRMYDAIEFRGNRQDDVEAARRARRRARVQRTDRRVAPDADARRLPDHARALRQAVRRHLVRVPGRLPIQHGPVTPGHRCAAGQRRPPCRPARALAARGRRRHRPRARRPERRAAITITDDVGRRRRASVDFVHTDVWVSMGEPQRGLGGAGEAAARPTRSTADLMKRTGNPQGQVHALPARVPRHEHRRRRAR